jgi:trehalose 6-phosphate synthase
MTERPTIIASNRGPIEFVRNDGGEIEAKRGSGGLVTALTGALGVAGGLWIASAMSEVDREQAENGRLEVAAGDDDYVLRYLTFEPETFDRYYNGISNRVLWFVHHCLWDLPRQPRFDHETGRDWEAYREVNEAFAAALDEEGSSSSAVSGSNGSGSNGDDQEPAFLIQDYHLSLVPAYLRARRPGARIAHFSHIPFAGPSYVRVLPTAMREELIAGMLGADVVGFHARLWANNFLLCCRDLPDAKVDLRRNRVRWEGRDVQVNVYPITIDAAAMQEQAESTEAIRALKRVHRWQGDAKLIVRVDRTELSKNILRGFVSFELFLQRYPEWRRRVKFLVQLNPSRKDLPEYRNYIRECVRTAERINDEAGEEDWQPIEISLKDDFPLALGAYSRYDVLLVNPVFDGMNLVAKEGPLLNHNKGVLILSENAGAHDELGKHAISINPFDVDATAEAIHQALEMPAAERTKRSKALRTAVLKMSLERWVGDQLRDLG